MCIRVCPRLPRDRRHGPAASAVLLLACAAVAAGCGDDSPELGVTDPAESYGGDVTRSVETLTAPGTAPAPAPAGGPRDDRSQIKRAITAVFASGDPDLACGSSVTESYVETAYGDAEGCRAAQSSGGHARTVTMARIAVEGDHATAIAVPIGGPSADELINLTLVRQEGDWKVDTARADVPVGP